MQLRCPDSRLNEASTNVPGPAPPSTRILDYTQDWMGTRSTQVKPLAE